VGLAGYPGTALVFVSVALDAKAGINAGAETGGHCCFLGWVHLRPPRRGPQALQNLAREEHVVVHTIVIALVVGQPRVFIVAQVEGKAEGGSLAAFATVSLPLPVQRWALADPACNVPVSVNSRFLLALLQNSFALGPLPAFLVCPLWGSLWLGILLSINVVFKVLKGHLTMLYSSKRYPLVANLHVRFWQKSPLQGTPWTT